MVSINNMSMEFSAKPLFNDISFIINKSDRLALVGKNGAGKSTLLKILAGQQVPTNGTISKPNVLTVGYLPQEMAIYDSQILIEEARTAFSEKIQLEKKHEELLQKITEREDFESEEYLSLLNEADRIFNLLSVKFPENIEAEIERTLLGLGFKKSDFNRPTAEFSGGWRMRIELAKILLKKPDLLLLDEPTNHLDINSIQWLEQFLTSKAGAVILVSHDRAFLDRVTTRTIEISCGKIYDYKVNYTNFENLRKERIEQQLKAYANQQKLIEDTKEFIERFRYKATKAVQVQSRIKQLEKIVPIEIDETDNSTINIKFPRAERSGDFPLIIEDLRKSYGTNEVFSNVNLTLRRGDKIAFVGSNGEGKSTLVKCINNEILFDGSLKLGHNVKIGYFAQNQPQLLDPSLSVFETIDKVATGDIRTRIKDLLAAFLFRGEDLDKKVSVLSGGEKTRLAMLKLILQPVNFLILDEPTNHLDMHTKDVLKKAIKEFDGTIIVVSHDREFLDGLVDKVYEFANGKVREYIGGIYDYLKVRNPDSELISNNRLINSTSNFNDNKSSVNQLSYEARKDFEKKLRKIEKRIEETESSISQIEEEIKEIETQIENGKVDDEILNLYSQKQTLLSTITNQWEEYQIELENLQKEKNERTN